MAMYQYVNYSSKELVVCIVQYIELKESSNDILIITFVQQATLRCYHIKLAFIRLYILYV